MAIEHKFHAVAYEENLNLRDLLPAYPGAKLGAHEIHVPLEGGGEIVQVPTNALEAVNQTATAIAGAFLTATAQAVEVVPTLDTTAAVTAAPVTPGFTPVATALPDTGLFDTVATGGTEGIGLLAIAVVGLVGVIFLSRRLRTMNDREAPPPPPSDQN